MHDHTEIRSYPERWVRLIPAPFWISWVLIWTIIFVTDFYLSRSGQTHSHLTELGVVVFCASICINLSVSLSVMKNLYPDLSLFIEVPEAELKEWYKSKLKWMYAGYGPLLAAAIFAAGVELTVGQTINDFNRSSDALLYFRMSYRIGGFFMLGLSIWTTIQCMRLPSQLVQFKFKLRLSNLSGIGLQALGATFFKLALLATVSFILLVCTILVSPISQDPIIILWVSIGALLIFCLFLLPQIGVHRIMAIEKKQQLASFSNHLEEALARSLKDPSTENLQKLKDMFDLQQYVKRLNDWPFDITLLWQLVSALLIPLLLVILQITFRG